MIYVVKSFGMYKIGYSRNPDRRFLELQTGCASKIETICIVEGSIHDEQALHKYLKPYNSHGEWYRKCKYIDGVIEDIKTLGVKAALGEAEHGYILSSHTESVLRDKKTKQIALQFKSERQMKELHKNYKENKLSARVISNTLGGWHSMAVDGYIEALSKDLITAISFLFGQLKIQIEAAKTESNLPISAQDLYSENAIHWANTVVDTDTHSLKEWPLVIRATYLLGIVLNHQNKVFPLAHYDPDRMRRLENEHRGPDPCGPPMQYSYPIPLTAVA